LFPAAPVYLQACILHRFMQILHDACHKIKRSPRSRQPDA
jgi:fatty acid desaturase